MMKLNALAVAVLSALSLASCANLERSRDLANPKVAPEVTARQVCSDCHGVDGNSVSPNFPRLAGQIEPYLVKQLQNFRGEQRLASPSTQYMWGMTRTLTDAQIEGLARYYSRQAVKPNPAAKSAEAASLTLGKQIFENGIPDKQAPACQACHGPGGQGMGPFPQLVGQHEAYLVKQLHIFQDNVGRPGTPMEQVSHSLTSQEMEAVADYLQSLPPTSH